MASQPGSQTGMRMGTVLIILISYLIILIVSKSRIKFITMHENQQ